MPDIRRAERVLKKWLRNQTMLVVMAGVLARDGSPPMAASVRGRLSLLPEQDVLILRSGLGSFLNIVSWSTAKTLDVKSSWEGTLIEVHFPHEILLVADYELPSEFFKTSRCHVRNQKNLTT